MLPNATPLREPMMRAWRTDLRVALRSLRRAPTFSIGTVSILALGIGTATAMFTVYKVVLVDRLPVLTQDRLVVMHPLDRRGTHIDVPHAYVATIARGSAAFRGVAGVYHSGPQALPFTSGSGTLKLGAASVTANYFDVLGVHPARGRLFRAEDSEAGAAPVVVLSYAAWQREFGGDSSAIGRTLIFPYTQERSHIVGVVPVGFDYPTGTDAWIPLRADTSARHLQ